MGKKYYLGIDCGSVSLKLVVMDDAKEIIWSDYQRTFGEPLTQLRLIFEKMADRGEMKDIHGFQGVYITGSGRFIIAQLLNGEPVNEITSHGMAGAYFYPDAKTIIEIGGQDSKLIFLDKLGNHETVIIDSQMNDICAAGTGSFLDQQAYRLGLSVAELSQKACLSRNPAKISGRCSVFAKTDLIHLQQNGISVPDLAAGLCLAVVRTYLENLIKGREIKKPLIFQGGVAKNEGVRQAFCNLLQLGDHDLIIPDNFAVMGAIGSVLYGLKKNRGNPVTREELFQKIAHQNRVGKQGGGLELLSKKKVIECPAPLEEISLSNLNVYLGIDVGSVSAKMVAPLMKPETSCLNTIP